MNLTNSQLRNIATSELDPADVVTVHNEVYDMKKLYALFDVAYELQ